MILYTDVSGRSALSLTGSDCLDFFQRISTNDVSQLKPGESCQTILTNEKGKIVDAVIIYRRTENVLLLYGQTRTPGSLISWLEKYIIMEDIKVEDITPATIQYIVYSNEDLDYAFIEQSLPPGCICSSELLAGSIMLRIACQLDVSAAVVAAFEHSGFSFAAQADYDDYRIRKGIPASGAELTAQYNPLESNLGALISWTKGCYIGQEVIARLDTYNKVQRKLVKMEFTNPPAEVPVSFSNGQAEAGTITSAARADSHGVYYGLGYLKLAEGTRGADYFFLRGQERISIQIRGSDSE